MSRRLGIAGWRRQSPLRGVHDDESDVPGGPDRHAAELRCRRADLMSSGNDGNAAELRCYRGADLPGGSDRHATELHGSDAYASGLQSRANAGERRLYKPQRGHHLHRRHHRPGCLRLPRRHDVDR